MQQPRPRLRVRGPLRTPHAKREGLALPLLCARMQCGNGRPAGSAGGVVCLVVGQQAAGEGVGKHAGPGPQSKQGRVPQSKQGRVPQSKQGRVPQSKQGRVTQSKQGRVTQHSS